MWCLTAVAEFVHPAIIVHLIVDPEAMEALQARGSFAQGLVKPDLAHTGFDPVALHLWQDSPFSWQRKILCWCPLRPSGDMLEPLGLWLRHSFCPVVAAVLQMGHELSQGCVPHMFQIVQTLHCIHTRSCFKCTVLMLLLAAMMCLCMGLCRAESLPLGCHRRQVLLVDYDHRLGAFAQLDRILQQRSQRSVAVGDREHLLSILCHAQDTLTFQPSHELM